jgi:EmrB/QacA subfamily drug resistance transporter
VATVVLCLTQFLVVVDGLAVSVALPAVGQDLRLSPTDMAWVLQAYILAFGGLLAVGGRAGDLFGHRRLLVAGLLLFAAASLAAGAANELVPLLLARGAQGFAAALMSPSALALLVNNRPEAERAKATALWSIIGGTGVVAGAAIGGVVTATAGWRWLFLVNVPVALVAVVVVRTSIRPSITARGHRLDLTGAIALLAAVSLMLYALPDGETLNILEPSRIAALALGGILLWLFVWWQRRRRDPLVPRRILADRKRLAANVGIIALNGGFACLLVFGSAQLQQIMGFTPLEAGLGLLPLALMTAIFGGVAERLIDRYGRTPIAVVGLSAMAVGFLLLAFAPIGGQYALSFLPGSALLGAGISGAYVPLTLLAVRAVPGRDRGVAIGVYQTFGQVGSAVVLAGVTAGAVLIAQGGAMGMSVSAELVRTAYSLVAIVLIVGVTATWFITHPPRGEEA